MPKSKVYDSSSIKQLKGLQAVRERVSMYLGDPTNGDALHHTVEEVVANSVDEHLAGHCSEIHVALLPNGGCSVLDNGRGIPVGPHPEEGIDTLELVLTSLHSGSKFDQDSYAKSAGLHGIGVSAINAVSSFCKATIWREGHEWYQTYSEGKPTAPVIRGAATKARGTHIEWVRDPSIFKGVVEYDRKRVADRLRELAMLNPGLTIQLIDRRSDKPWEYTFSYEGGIKDYLAEILGKKKTVAPPLYFTDGQAVELAMAWTESDGEDTRCYANNTFNRDGGTHLTGFRFGLTRLIQNYAKEHNMLKGLGDEGITGSDIREGLVAIVSIKIPDISFSSQTKDKLVTPRAKDIVEELFADRVEWYFKDNPAVARRITERAVISAKAREAARRARENVKRKEWMDPMSLPGKLADCQSKDPAESELFIVEGSSAGGCLSGDTLVRLADGRSLGMADLAKEHATGKVNYVYSCNVETGEIELRKIVHAWKTKRAATVKVTLDNDQSFCCTPDHPVLLTTGEFAPPRAGQSLVPIKATGLHAFNLKIKSVRTSGKIEDVYDLEIEGVHNFGLDCGVFVHNSAKDARDRRYQAILPLRGKVLNVERASTESILDNQELGTLITAIGCGVEQTGSFDLKKLRYHKVVLMTDADVDGEHIRTLLLTFLYRCMPRLIYYGYVYIAQPPLYGARLSGARNDIFFTNDEDLAAYEATITDAQRAKIHSTMTRYKGLGEMNADDLWCTTLDPECRVLKQVTIADAVEAERLFEILMSDSVEARKDFISANALEATNLDI